MTLFVQRLFLGTFYKGMRNGGSTHLLYVRAPSYALELTPFIFSGI